MNSWPVWHRLSERLHRSFLITLSIACLLGQGCVEWGWSVLSPLWLVGAVCFTLTAWSFGGRTLAGLLVCLLITFCLSNLALQRVLDPPFPPQHLRQLALPQNVLVEAWLYREPERLSHRTRLYLQASQYWQKDKTDEKAVPVTGRILVTVRHVTQAWQYGDVIRLPLRVRAPRNFKTPGSFDYESYLARRGIHVTAFLWDDKKIEQIEEVEKSAHQASVFRSWIEDTRRTIGVFFTTHLDSQTDAILRALIIGDTGGITKEVRETFARAGVAHLLAISGLHIGLVAVAAYGVWWWLLGRSQTLLLSYTMPKLAALLTMPPVLLYAGLAGGRVATWRAVIMVFVYLVSILLGRQQEVYRSLALAALLISAVWPGAVFDVSFQLSFVSMLVIFLGMARFSVWWELLSERHLFQLRPWRGRVLRWGAAYLALSAFAIIGTAPITAAHFNQVAIAGLFANLIVIPLLGSAAVILGLASAALSFVHEGGATLVLFWAGFVIQAATWIVEWISAWPHAAFHIVTPTLFELLLLYGLLACVFWHFSLPKQSSAPVPQPTPNPQSLSPITLALTLLFLLFADCTYWTWQRFFNPDLRVTFLDVGQGDAAVVEFPGSHVMVIDGGGFASRTFDSGQAIIAPFLWARKIGRIDTLVMSHPQLDHYGGLAFLAEHFSPSEFWFNGEETDSERFAKLEQALEQSGVTVRVLCRESPDMNLSGVHIQVVHPSCQGLGLDTNNASLVLRLSHGEIDFLFSGDIEAEGESIVLATGKALQSEVLKVPHHGSRSSSTVAFVQAVSPQLAIASLGLNNRFGFPAPEVVQRYLAHRTPLLRTDQIGTVTVVSDGKRYWIANSPLPSRDKLNHH